MDRSGDEFEAWRTSFAGAVPAGDYDTYRPGYPTSAVTWMLGEPDGPLHVLDLGAGTGKLSATLVALGHRVTAVDPSGPMLDQLEALMPSVDVRTGTGEQVPLDDAAVDAVVIGQAWHWMDSALAGPEIARVLRPGGWLGLVWNTRDASVDWVARLYEVAGEPVRERRDDSEGTDTDDDPRVPGPYGPPEPRRFDNPHVLESPDAVAALAGTWSWVRTSPDPATRMAGVRDVAAAHAEPDGSVRIPQVSECYRFRRGPQPVGLARTV